MYKALMTIAEDSVRQMPNLHNTQTRLRTYQELTAQAISRQMRIYQGLWDLALHPRLAASLWSECLAIQAAGMQRLATQRAHWVRGLEAIVTEIGSLKKVNTLSKLMDQETDISASLNALVMGQARSTMELMESIQINIGYLVAQKEQEAMG